VARSAIVIDAANGSPEGGLIVERTIGRRQKLFTRLRTFIALGGDQVGATVTDETYNGTTITIVSLDTAKLSGMAGGSAPSLPVPTGNVEIAYAVTDKVVVIGSGADFVKAVLDTTRPPRSRRTTTTRRWPTGRHRHRWRVRRPRSVRG
jgi:hypothetical protein